MTISVPAVDITGIQEQVIRDNVDNPDSNLLARALAQLVAPYQSQSMNRAEQAYREAFAADPAQTLPNMLDKEAVLAWYFARDEYRDATQRAADSRKAQIPNEISSLQAELNRHRRRLEALADDASAEITASIEKTISGIEDQIDALTEEHSSN